MKNSESNVANIIYEIAEEENLSILSLSMDWAFCLKKGEKKAFIVGYQFPLNKASVKEICQDKALTSEFLEASEIPVTSHLFLPDSSLKAYTGQEDSFLVAKRLLEKMGTVVIKDNFGTGGNKVFLVKTEEELKNALDLVFTSSTAASLSPFYEIEEEYRSVVLDGEVRLMIRKERMSVTGDGKQTVRMLFEKLEKDPVILEKIDPSILEEIPKEGEKKYLNWKHNLGQGAEGIIVTDSDVFKKVSDLAVRTAKALSIRFASVDIVSVQGELLVLEVNGGVMMEHFSGQSEEHYKLAKEIYRDAILKSFQ